MQQLFMEKLGVQKIFHFFLDQCYNNNFIYASVKHADCKRVSTIIQDKNTHLSVPGSEQFPIS